MEETDATIYVKLLRRRVQKLIAVENATPEASSSEWHDLAKGFIQGMNIIKFTSDVIDVFSQQN